MAERFIPRADRILVRPIEVKRKPGSLAQPDAQKEKPTRGVVLAVGIEAMGERIISETGQVYAGVRGGVEIGQVVEWNKHAGKELIVNGEALVRLRLEEIEGTWESTE